MLLILGEDGIMRRFTGVFGVMAARDAYRRRRALRALWGTSVDVGNTMQGVRSDYAEKLVPFFDSLFEYLLGECSTKEFSKYLRSM